MFLFPASMREWILVIEPGSRAGNNEGQEDNCSNVLRAVSRHEQVPCIIQNTGTGSLTQEAVDAKQFIFDE